MEALGRFKERFRSSPPAYSQELLDEFDGEDDYYKNASTNRARTDVPFLVMQGCFLFVLVFFLGYCMTNSDIDRLIIGYDNCGNVCGKNNDFIVESQMSCKSEDMSHKPFLFIDGHRRECVTICDPFTKVLIGKRCFYKNSETGQISNNVDREMESYLNDVARDLHTCSGEITILCFVALGFAFLILMVLRYLTAAFVWSVLIGVVSVFISATGYFWYLTDTTDAVLPVAIISSIVTVIIILVILVMRKRIQLVIQLLKEAGKSITDIPLLLFEPLLTFGTLGIGWSAWIYCVFIIESAGIPIETNGNVIYKQNAAMRFTRWYNIFTMFWMLQFVYGCQNMLIAGAVSRWYFTRNKNRLDKPIYNSVSNMMKYHLGTISFGSLIIVLTSILRILCRQLRRVCRVSKCCLFLCCLHNHADNCMAYLEALMIYLTRNAYIITSIHGYPFYEAGTRAFKLLTENALRVVAINSVGDFVLILAKMFIVAGTVITGLLMLEDKPHVENTWAALLLAGLIAYLIAHCFITVYEMAIDTIFMCFCEDCEINDGVARPYFMSQGLMEFVNKSKAVLGIKLAEEVNPVVVITTHQIQ